MSSRTPSMSWGEPEQRAPGRAHLPSVDLLAAIVLWFIVIVCAALVGLALGGG